MDEERWSFSQIALATGLEQQCLQRLRRNRGLYWNPQGYTLEEIIIMAGSCAAPQEALAGCRSRKALRLRALLAGKQG